MSHTPTTGWVLLASSRASPGKAKQSEEDPLLTQESPPSVPYLLAVTIYAFPLSVIWSTMGLIILPAEAIRLFPTDESFFLGIFLVIVGVTQLVSPIAGLLSDRYQSRFGRRRPFIFIGSAIGLVGVSLMAFGSLWINGWAFTLGLILSMTSLNVIFTVQTAIVPDVCKDEKGSSSGIVACLSQGGNLFGMVWIVGTSGLFVYHWAYLLYTVLMIFAGSIVCIALKEKPTNEGTVEPITWQEIKNCFWLDCQGEGERNFFWVFVGRTFYYMSVSVQAFLYYYLRDMLLISNEVDIQWQLAVLVIIAMAFAMLVAYPLGKYSEMVGRLPLIYSSCIIMAIGTLGYILVPLLDNLHGKVCVYIIAGVYGVGSGAFLAVDYALALDCLPDKTKGSSQALGIWGISAFLGSAIGPLIGGCLLEVFGNFGKGGHYTYPGYVALLSFGGVMCLFSALSMRFIKKVR